MCPQKSKVFQSPCFVAKASTLTCMLN